MLPSFLACVGMCTFSVFHGSFARPDLVRVMKFFSFFFVRSESGIFCGRLSATLATELAALEISMKRDIFILFFLVATPLFAQQPPEIRFHSVPNFLKLPPHLHLGEATALACDSKAHVFSFSPRHTPAPP